MFKCYTFPVGDVPSNDSWSGFQMVNEKADEGYLLLFREMHNTESQKRVELKFLSNKTMSITNLENGNVSQQKVSANGDAAFFLKDQASYLFLKYSIKGNN